MYGSLLYDGVGEFIAGTSSKEKLGSRSMLVQVPVPCPESAEVYTVLEEAYFHDSGAAEYCEGKVGCHQFSAPVELGRTGVGRTTSAGRGGGGRSGRNMPMMAVLTSSLRPQSSSPAPSSSNPSRAMALVR